MFKAISKFPCPLCKRRVKQDVKNHMEKFVDFETISRFENKRDKMRLEQLKTHYKQSSEVQNQLHSNILEPFYLWESKTHFCSYPGSHY